MAMNTQQRQMMKVQEVILDSYCGTSKQLAKKHENMCLVPITSYLKTVMYYYSVVSIKRTGLLNYFEVFSHPVLFFHVLKKKFAPPCSFFHVLKKKFAPPCSLITSCSLNRYYRVHGRLLYHMSSTKKRSLQNLELIELT